MGRWVRPEAADLTRREGGSWEPARFSRAGMGLFGEARRRSEWLTTGALVAAAVCWQFGADVERRLFLWSDGNRGHREAARWVQTHLPIDAVVFAHNATGPLQFYTDRQLVRSDHVSLRGSSSFFARIVATGRLLYALNYHWEVRGFGWQGHGDGRPDLPGEWECLGALWRDDIYLWKWRGPTPAEAGRDAATGGTSSR
jgi:hypothetical protein